MKVNKIKRIYTYLIGNFAKVFMLCILFSFTSIITFSQSSDQNLPTPITSNQISGEIKARDIGDSRLTTYYFIFNGNRGDIFINVVTTNLNGDIDIFTLEGLKPRTKITLFADSSENETGRVIYMRKPEKLLLRIQGRTPNDDPATYQIKFAGSFKAVQGVARNDDSLFPEVKNSSGGTVKVNSVGTIIEQPKPKPTPAEIVAENKTEEKTDTESINDEKIKDSDEVKNSEEVSENKTTPETKNESENKSTPEIPSTFDPTKKVDDVIKDSNKKNNARVLITDPFKETENKVEPKKDEPEKIETKELTLDIKEKKSNTSAIVRIERDNEVDEAPTKKTEEKANPLAGIFLKIKLKNGKTFKRPMSEVVNMNVVNGVLTVSTSDGKFEKFLILEIKKQTIE